MILRAGASPAQIAGGLTLGMFLGFMPLFNLYSLFVLLLLLILNVNLSMAIFGMTIFALFSFLLDSVFHDIGYMLLVEVPALHPFWTTLYNIPLFPFTRFNNTVVLGSLVTAMVLSLPLFLLARLGVIAYRAKLEPKIKQMKIVTAIQGSSVYQLYVKIRSLTE
jgi:uncharacterized protein (TIGR03546 family)